MRCRSRGRVSENGLLRINTPIEHYPEYNLWVKREDLACLPPGPPFSKVRGVYAHLLSVPHRHIGVLDTYHSQGGWAVALVCRALGKLCTVYYPEYLHDPGYRYPQERALALGAALHGLPAGRSAVLWHAARRATEGLGGYMLPNALKLPESVAETAEETPNRGFDNVVISASSGTLAAGVIKGFTRRGKPVRRFVVHLGYSRSHEQLLRYLHEQSGCAEAPIEIIDEEYSYKDKARDGETPPWPCNEYYDLKAFRWWLENRRKYGGSTLFWNIG